MHEVLAWSIIDTRKDREKDLRQYAVPRFLQGRTTMSDDQRTVAVLTRPNPFATLFQEIGEVAEAALRRSPYYELHGISCEFSGGVLTLRGRAPTYYLKQLAQACVADVPGVVEVDNRVEVTSSAVLSRFDTGWKRQRALASA
jgi:hypothetical protein